MANKKEKKREKAGKILFKSKGGRQVLFIQISKEIEALFKTEETEVSDVYKTVSGNGLVFYKIKPSLEQYTERYSQTTGERVSLRRYGTNLFVDG